MAIPEEQIPKVVSVQAIRKIEAERNGTMAEIGKMQVDSLADSDVANVILRKLTLRIKIIKEEFKPLVDKAKASYDAVRALRAKVLSPPENAKANLDTRLQQWRREERQRRSQLQAEADVKRREREELEEKHAEVGHKPPGPEPVIEEPVALEAEDTTKVRWSWEVEITDIWKVPKEYLVFNEPAIRANLRKAVQASKDDTGTPTIEIPGVNIFSKETPVYA